MMMGSVEAVVGEDKKEDDVDGDGELDSKW
jgi:hypothetical protein